MAHLLGSSAAHSIPLTTIAFEGNRYVAHAEFERGGAVPLMVHGNARVYLSLAHDVAEILQGGPVPKVDAYGYTARGRGSIDVRSMRLGDVVFEDLLGVPVFDLTDGLGAPARGMLGTRFLLEARAAVDFTTDSLHLGVEVADAPSQTLVERGYRHVPLRVAEDRRITIDVRFPAIDRTLPITPSTVGEALTLHRPPFVGRIAMRASSRDRSPSGTSPAVAISDGIDFEVGGVAFRSPASLQDLAEYANVTESNLESFGMLGFDWMRAHRAVIDYANLRLSFLPLARPQSPRQSS